MSHKRKHDETDEDSKEDKANKKQKLDDEEDEGEDKKIVKIWNKLINAVGAVKIREATEDEIDCWEKEEKEYIQKGFTKHAKTNDLPAQFNTDDFKFPREYRAFLRLIGHLPERKEDRKVTNPKQKERASFSGFWDFVFGWKKARGSTEEFLESLLGQEEIHPHWMLICVEYSTFGVYFINCDSKAKDYGSIYRFESNSSDIDQMASSLSEFLRLLYNYFTDVFLFNDFEVPLLAYKQDKTIQRREKKIDTVLDDNWKQVKLKQFEKTTVKDVCDALKGQIYIPSCDSQLMTIKRDDSDKIYLVVAEKDYPVERDLNEKCCFAYNELSGYACYIDWNDVRADDQDLAIKFYIPLEQAREITDGAIDKVELKKALLMFLVKKNEQS